MGIAEQGVTFFRTRKLKNCFCNFGKFAELRKKFFEKIFLFGLAIPLIALITVYISTFNKLSAIIIPNNELFWPDHCKFLGGRTFSMNNVMNNVWTMLYNWKYARSIKSYFFKVYYLHSVTLTVLLWTDTLLSHEIFSILWLFFVLL